jgi:chemotaxis protein MotB
MAEREQERFEDAAAELRQAIQAVPELAQLEESLIIDQTPEGLRIQIVDQERLAMFATGSANPEDHTRRQLANQISISGHTDATPYRGAGDYSNWELSADRANAARRLLVSDGLDPARIALVQGKAETDPLLADEPESPRNRRISIILLRQSETGAQTSAAPPPENMAAPGALRPPTTAVDIPGAD